MARSTFGGTAADVLLARGPGGRASFVPGTLTLWTAETGGTQVTDLLVDGGAVTSIAVGADGQVPAFQGPDSVGELWADAGAGRIRIVAEGKRGLPGVNAVPTADAMAAYTNDPDPNAFKTALATSIEDVIPHISVDEQRLSGDVDDTESWRRAIALAISLGVRRVIGRKSDYYLSGRIDCVGANGLTISGAGAKATVMHVSGATGVLQSLFYSSGALDGLTISDMEIRGTAVNDVTAPRRSRTFTGNGLNSAAIFEGNLRSGASFAGRPTISNVELNRVRIVGTRGLPWLFDGLGGLTEVYDTTSINTMDGGFIYCDHVLFDRITSIDSADNGVSISRGCRKVTGGRVDVVNCAYFGVWVAGYVADPGNLDPTWTGPKNFSIDTINVTTAGKGGVQLDDAPSDGRIGNIFVNGVRRGPSDEPSDISGLGIRVGGFPSSNRPSPTAFATSIKIDNALLMNCQRGGVAVSGAKDVMLGSVTVIDAGTQFKADGTTAIATNDLSQNFGVACEPGAEATVTRLSVRSLRVIDTRTTPRTNYPLYTTGSVTPDVSQVSFVNTNQGVTSNDNTNDAYGGTKTFFGNAKFTGGFTTGANGATGVVAGPDLNGAAGSTRPVRWQTAAVDRWHERANSDAESGSDSGSNFELASRTDAGALKHIFYRVMRAAGVWTWLRAHAENRVAQTLPISGAVTIDAASGNIQSITLGANATSSSISNPTTGQRLTVSWSQDATGGRTYAWPSNCLFAGGAAPAASTSAGYRDRFQFEFDGTNWLEISRAVGVR